MSLDVDVRAWRDGFRLDASLRARPGETVALLGPNGAGKSTLVSVLAGLVVPDEGRVALDDSTLDDVAAGLHVEPEARPLGVVFQGLLLFPHLSARENVAFPLRASGVRRAESLARADGLLHELGIADRAAAPPRELSGGQAQRVALARALIRRPRMLLLDEPLASLDVAARGRARTLISETLGGFAGVRILVTHDPVEAMTLADRIVVLEAGRVTQSGTPDEVREAPRTAYAAELVGVNLFEGRLDPLPDGAGRMATANGDIIVAWPVDRPRAPTSGVLAIVRPSDVAIHLDPPAGSARNVVRGTIASISIDGDRARVRADASPSLVADVTIGSMKRLGLETGSVVWLSFKAVEVAVVPP
jgi:molybdate transport system ATP-binding protein